MVCMCGLGDASRWHQELEEGSRRWERAGYGVKLYLQGL